MVTIVLDKERRMRLTLRGMIAYEEQTGKSLLNGFDLKDMTMKQFTILAWACMIHEDKDMTYGAFIDMLELSDIPRLTDAVSACIVESFPDQEGGKESPLA